MPSETALLLKRTPLLAEKMADQLRRSIVEGRHKPGEKLPTERELSESYGVSRSIVREALGRLKQDHLIQSRQGSGAFVADSINTVFRLEPAVPFDTAGIKNIVELLGAVESTASAYAAMRRTSAQMKLIRRRFDAISDAIAHGLPGRDEDIAFHRAIIDATGNPVFQDMLEFLDSRVQFIRTARAKSGLGVTDQVQEEHRSIMDAIAAGDAAASRIAAERHLQNALARLLRRLES
jgi:GntR family transcriptional repressor for pyruvate dehydrogenase complex